IDADWAAQRIKTLTLWGAVKSAIFGNRGNKHKTLVDQFAYPFNGTGTIYERAADHVVEHGGIIHKKRPIKRIILDESKSKVIGLETMDGEIHKADHVVSTMPITLMIKGFDHVSEKVQKAIDKLYFRNTILVYLEIDRNDLVTDNWLYIHSPDVTHVRITNFRIWSPNLTKDKKTTILCMEILCYDEDKIL